MKKLLALFIVAAFSLGVQSCRLYRNKMTIQSFGPVQYHPESIAYSPIIWHSDSVGDEWIEKTSFFIPVTLNGISEKLYMQFDLGSPVTLLYGNTLEALAEKYPAIQEKIVVTEKERTYFHDARLNLSDSICLSAKKLPVIKYGSSAIDTGFTIVGSTGYDLIGDNVLILDFKNDRYALTDFMPSELSEKVKYIEEPDLARFPIILPFYIGDKKIRLFYDSGSSLFPILTGTNRLKRLDQTHGVDTVGPLNSWGKQHLYARVKEGATLSFNGLNLGKIDVYGRKDLNILKLTGGYVYGITGNALFADKIIVIDRKNNKFGIVE
ncbi:MAG: hypothetical protein R6U66_14340 [Bacteroidales bacterium]